MRFSFVVLRALKSQCSGAVVNCSNCWNMTWRFHPCHWSCIQTRDKTLWWSVCGWKACSVRVCMSRQEIRQIDTLFMTYVDFELQQHTELHPLLIVFFCVLIPKSLKILGFMQKKKEKRKTPAVSLATWSIHPCELCYADTRTQWFPLNTMLSRDGDRQQTSLY